MTDATSPTVEPTGAAPVPPAAKPRPQRITPVLALAALLAAAGIGAFAWTTHQRMRALEQELVRRQQDAQGQVTESRVIAKQAQDAAREALAKATLLEARVAEAALQRSQLEELIQSLSRSRDENLVVDIEAGLRVALQQSTLTGSAEPVVAALKSADERLARVNQPRLAGVRRAVARDLDRVKAVAVADLPTLIIKLDEAVRMVDDLPLLAAEPRAAEPAKPSRAITRGSASAPQPAASAASAAADWSSAGRAWAQTVWDEVRSLLRVTRIDQPDAMLLAPEQSWFLRENLKLRLLNARLALLSRQFDTVQTDLQAAQAAIDRYADRHARRTAALSELVRGVASQARQAGVPRPDETLAALAAAAAGR
ncbi:uroporphyrinogen-III C-methyltransferase [Caldimonas sp. KR1-144]|uniref:uroporphyrinogen-III C-methyltransferase n=1 Tax=Caldimonas sp. KR1-144 TaxID=3400911 RepID=UPI003C11BA34